MRISFLTAFLFVSSLISAQAQQTLSPRKKWYDAKTRPEYSTLGRPQVEYTTHSRGNIQLAIANNGTFGTYGQDIADPFTGQRIQSLIYPKNSDIVYLWVGAFWIGAVVGRDTLVSTGTEDFYEHQEFWPGEKYGNSYFTYQSIDLNSRYYDENAHSEEDITCEYYDTLTDPSFVSYDSYDQRPHIPLGIKVQQKSMAWSYDYADDFILFDYQIENIGQESLNDVYMGIWVDGDVWHVSRRNEANWTDDIVGFLRTHPAPEGGNCIDTVNIAYTADNDGDPNGSEWDYRSTRGAVGVRVVRTPLDTLKYSYNWWIINYSDAGRDFGPRRLPGTNDPFRSFGARLGTPEGDRNKYYILRHEEFDYDLIYTAIDHSSEGWLHPPENAEVYATGYDTRYLLSFGPFNVDPGQKLPISLAFVGGENLHQEPTDFEALFDPYDPDVFYNSLDFSSLAHNSRWASWIYDNPGVDTDGDGYYGKYRVCNEAPLKDNDGFNDSVKTGGHWYEGDGVPDFKGAGPPPAPRMRIIPANSKLTIRWNGYYSENTPDVFLQKIDFEGYRVYAALDDRSGSFTLLSSYDKENYNRYIKKALPGGDFAWFLEETPFTLDSLRIIYEDPNFDPLRFTLNKPLEYNDTLYYFEPQDYNVSDLSSPKGIHKVYPEITSPPPADSTLWTENDLSYDYDPPLPKYYEYEYVYENILPTIAYYVSVTAFDFGSPIAGLKALETKPVNNMIIEYPLTPADTVESKDLDVYVYPNPYRIDGNYFELGFEGRDDTYKIPDRIRRIHFANLPKVCKIYIYSLDGDLIRELDHNYPEGGPQSMHDTWDLITRNTQRAVTGIYYFVVESSTRTQIGKFVIIR